MRNFLLLKIRLSWYFIFFFVLYYVLSVTLPRLTFEGSMLTLFSVNSFLYGFYISPILNAQKARIEELHKVVRSEANAIFAIVLTTKKMPESLGNELRARISIYLRNCSKNRLKLAQKNYESLISYCIDYKGKDADNVEKFLEKLVANQQNRTLLNMQLTNRVYSNEWMIMFVLFSITLSFIILLDTGSSVILHVVAALLCTGLSMLMLILAKLSTLTHKKARQIWKPFETLLATKYYQIVEAEEA